MSIKIYRNNNRLLIQKNDEIIFPYAYMTYVDDNNDYKNFIDLGFNLFSISTILSEHGVNEMTGIPALTKGLFLKKEALDFSPLDESIERIVSLKNDAYIIVRVNLNVPDWWRKENPDETIKLSDGKTYMESPTSEKFIEFAKNVISQIYDHIINSKYKENVIALHLGGLQTEEWIAMCTASGAFNYSKSFLDYYKNYLENKYNTKIDNVSVPNFDKYTLSQDFEPIDYIKFKDQIDYLEAYNNATADAIIELVKYTKNLVKNNMLVGVFYGYIGQLHAAFGHSAISKVINSKSLDFLAFPPAYVNQRQGANDFFYHSVVNSLNDRDIIVFVENDIRTYKSKFVFEVCKDLNYSDETKAHLSALTWRGPTTPEESVSVLTRSFAKTLISNQAYWWFDMWGDFYNDAKMHEFIGKSQLLIENSEVTSNNEFALILDEKGSYETNEYAFHFLSYQFIRELGFVGASYDIYSVEDVDKIKDKYKALIFVIPSHFTREKYQLNNGVGNYFVGNKIEALKLKASYEDIASLLLANEVHLYSPGNIVYQSKEFICVTARENGKVVLSFDKEVTLINAYLKTEQYKGKEVTLELQSNFTKLFKIM